MATPLTKAKNRSSLSALKDLAAKTPSKDDLDDWPEDDPEPIVPKGPGSISSPSSNQVPDTDFLEQTSQLQKAIQENLHYEHVLSAQRDQVWSLVESYWKVGDVSGELNKAILALKAEVKGLETARALKQIEITKLQGEKAELASALAEFGGDKNKNKKKSRKGGGLSPNGTVYLFLAGLLVLMSLGLLWMEGRGSSYSHQRNHFT